MTSPLTNTDTIEYLKLAIQQGLAFEDISDIEILGLHLKEVKKKFSRATLEEKELKKHNIKILEGGACSGCRITLEAYLYRMQKDGLFSNIKDHTFILGQNVKVPKDLKGPIVKFGACTKATKAKTLSQEIMYVQGCPPHPHMTDQYIESGKLY